MSTSDAVRAMLNVCGKKQIDLASSFGMSKQSMANKFAHDRWSAIPRSSVQRCFPNKKLIQIAVECIAYQVQLLKAYSITHLVVEIVDSRRSNTGYSRQVRLRPAPFAEACRKQNPDHRTYLLYGVFYQILTRL